MDEDGGRAEDLEEEEEEEDRIDPRSLKPDLYTAAVQNDTARVLELLDGKVPPTFVDDHSGWTPLHWAAKNGNIVMLNRMIEAGATDPYHRMVTKAKAEAAKRLEDAKLGQSVGFLSTSHGSGGDAESKENADSDHQHTHALGESSATGADGAIDSSGATAGVDTDPVVMAAAAAIAAAEAAAAAMEEQGGEDEDDEDDEWGMERRLETSVDLTKNTPLLWACVKGNMSAVWSLLSDGYSPNDLDDMSNNALHLAAAASNKNVVKALIDDGVVSTRVNVYKNLPIDMATDKEVRELIADAMKKGASMTASDIELKHDSNMKTFSRMTNSLHAAVARATDLLDSFDRGSRSPRAPGVGSNIGETVRVLAEAIRISREWSLDAEAIAAGEKCIALLEMGQELIGDIATAEKESPFRTQAQYIQHIHKIEASIARASELGVTEKIISYGQDLVQRAQIEYWISTLAGRLSGVECALDVHEYDMNKLKSAIVKGQVQRASPEIVEEATNLHRRLDAELGMTRALQSIPASYKLPYTGADGPPPGYYSEADIGHVKETEEYPNPPEGGEYIWEPAENFAALQSSVTKLKESYSGAEALGANPAIVAEAKTRLVKVEKDLKLLTVKEEADKLAGIEAAQKKCKKKPAAKAKK